MATAPNAVTRVVQPSETWSFSLALELLKSAPELAARDALDEFLTHNEDVVLLSVPFYTGGSKGDGNRSLDAAKTEFSLRGVKYTGVTPRAVQAAQKLANSLSIDVHEALRIVLQTDRRSPAPITGDRSVSRLLFGGNVSPDSGVNSATDCGSTDRLPLYTKAVMRERRAVLRIASQCFNLRHVPETSFVVRNLGKSLVASPDYLLEAVRGLDFLVSLFSSVDQEESGLHCMELVLFSTQLLQLVFDVLLARPEVPTDFAKAWFALMSSTSFMLELAHYVANKDAFSVFHGLVTLVSLQVFDLSLINPAHLAAPEVFDEINRLITTQSPNNILAYAWLIICHRKSILLEEFPSSHESFLVEIPLLNIQNAIVKLQNILQDSSVFCEIAQLNKVLSFDNIFAVVLTDMILAAVPLIHATDDIISCISEILSSAPNASIEKFFDNEDARLLVVLARAKFPFSLGPYLQLLSINGNFALHELEELSSYMSVFGESEFNALYNIDSENTDLVHLTESVDIFPPFEPGNKLSLFLKTGTKAKIFPTSHDKVLVTFLHKYNGWAFLGRIMQNISKMFDTVENEKIKVLECILDVLIRTSAENSTDASVVLEYMSTYTDDSDIVDVIFRLFEQSMHNRNVVLLGKILCLLSNLMPIVSNRIWPYLSTSSLLSNKGKEGFLSVLFGSIETVLGDYFFTNSLVKFVFCLANDNFTLMKDYSEDARSEIFARLIEHIIQVFENFENCKFNDSFQRFELGILILDVFQQTLNTVHSVGCHLEATEKPARVFVKASQKIVDAFLTTTPSYSRSSGFIIDLIDSLASENDSFDSKDISNIIGDVWVQSAFSFAKLLVRVRNLLNLNPSRLEESLFSKLPQLVTIYSEGGPLRNIILDLLTVLTSGKWESEKMPSILSHLGQDHSRILLNSLAADLETSFDDFGVKIAIYDFLCSIMEANQQGLAVLFISGRNIFGELSETQKNQTEDKTISLLAIMKNNIQQIKLYPAAVSVHLLDAISLAFNSWTTARSEDSDVAFVNELTSLLETFEKRLDPKNATGMILASYDCTVYAKITEILSLVLFTTKNERCIKSIQGVLSDTAFIEKLPLLFTILDYDVGLYEKTKTFFNKTYEKYNLSDFAVSFKKRNRFGSGMIYDLPLLDSFFCESTKWTEIRDQIVYLSANLQYYHSQISLCKSMGALMTTFCRRMPASLPKGYSRIVHDLLLICEPRDIYSELFSSHQYYERIELAFLLIYTLNDTDQGKQSLVPLSMDIIQACSDLMENPNVGYLCSNKEDSSFRSLLRVVYIALANLKSDFAAVNTRTQILFRLFEYVVAKGTTGIIVGLQNDVYLARTNKNYKIVNLSGRLDDLRLILSVLKVFVELETSSAIKSDLSATLTKHNTIDTLLSLYSFSHLILVPNEPIFAQISLMFIQQLLLVEEFSQRIVDSKLFVVVRESMISQPLRNGGISIANEYQLHGTWTNGILPIIVLCLSRGKAVNESIFTLRTFSKQIESTIEAWSHDASTLQVSSAGTFETLQLLYIYLILMAMATAQGLTVNSVSDVDMPITPGLDTQQKRDDFIGFISNLLKHPKFLKSRVYPSSSEEKALMHTGGSGYEVFVEGLMEDIKELKDFLI